MEQVSLERVQEPGNPPQEWITKGILMAFISEGEQAGADMDSDPGLSSSRCCSWGDFWWASSLSAGQAWTFVGKPRMAELRLLHS